MAYEYSNVISNCQAVKTNQADTTDAVNLSTKNYITNEVSFKI